jgi:hypothetical protein
MLRGKWGYFHGYGVTLLIYKMAPVATVMVVNRQHNLRHGNRRFLKKTRSCPKPYTGYFSASDQS